MGDLAHLLDMSSSAISHQLNILSRARLVKFRREGKWAVYSLKDRHIKDIFEIELQHAVEEKGGVNKMNSLLYRLLKEFRLRIRG